VRESDVPRTEAHMANIAKSSGARITIATTVFAPTLSAEFPPVVPVGTGRELVGRPVKLPPPLELEPPDPFSLFAFLTNASKFSQSESFALMAPTPPAPHPQMSWNQIVLFSSASLISTVSVVSAVPLTVSRKPE